MDREDSGGQERAGKCLVEQASVVSSRREGKVVLLLLSRSSSRAGRTQQVGRLRLCVALASSLGPRTLFPSLAGSHRKQQARERGSH